MRSKAGAHTVRPEPRTVICFVLTPQRLAAYIVRPRPFILKARWLWPGASPRISAAAGGVRPRCKAKDPPKLTNRRPLLLQHTRQPSCVSVPHYEMSQLNHLGSWTVMPPSKRGQGQTANTQKVEQRCSLLSRGPRAACESSVLSLHVALSFACSVASLSHCPNHYRPGSHSLHCSTLADYLLDQGGLPTCFAGRRELGTTPSPCSVVAGGWILPSFRAT